MSLILQFIAAKALAQTASTLFPGAILVRDHCDEAGFSCEIAFRQRMDCNAIPLLEEGLRERIKQEIPMQILEMMRENAVNLLEHHQQPIKADLVADDPCNIVRILKMGDFYDPLTLDLPDGQDLHTGLAGAIKILSIEEKPEEESLDNYCVAVISGVAAENKQELKHWVKKHEFARRNNPLQLGLEMDLFHIDPKIDSKGIFWNPRGVILRELLYQLGKANSNERPFQQVITPPVPSIDKSALLAHFFTLRPFSFHEFPIRLAESSTGEELLSWGNEPPAIYYQTTDRRQILCLEEQIQKELISSLQFIYETRIIMGFRCQWILLSSQGKSSQGKSSTEWRQRMEDLRQALSSCGFPYEERKTQQVLPGPRVELQVKDVLERSWTLSTLEFHLALARQAALQYRGLESNVHPVLLCETLFTSREKALALLLQNSEGILPFQLAPEQIKVLPVGSGQLPYANLMAGRLKQANFRVGIDLKDDPLGNKIHRAEKEKIPYQVIVGEQEAKENQVSIRLLGQKMALKKKMPLEVFIQEHLCPHNQNYIKGE